MTLKKTFGLYVLGESLNEDSPSMITKRRVPNGDSAGT
jgi:hypothetical protein